MADGFSVDVGALENAAEGVGSTLAQLKAHAVAELAGASGDYGDADLAATVADFCGRWERGVENLATDGQQVVTRLAQSVQAYLHVDGAAAEHLGGLLTRSAGDDPGVH